MNVNLFGDFVWIVDLAFNGDFEWACIVYEFGLTFGYLNISGSLPYIISVWLYILEETGWVNTFFLTDCIDIYL